MPVSGAVRLAAFLLIGLAIFGRAVPAQAGSTATRCDAQGCVHVHCNATGDRCYRYADGPNVPLRREHFSPHGYGSGNFRPLCDTDGDRCYPSPNRRWDYRAFYRSLGYHWDDEAH